jgi:hypothetical protein
MEVCCLNVSSLDGLGGGIKEENYEDSGSEKHERIDENQKYPKNKNIQKRSAEKSVKKHYIQKYHEDDLIAEAVIVGGKAYFAVASPKLGNPQEISITLHDSIPLDGNTILQPAELISYINRPYIFRSKEEFEKSVVYARNENLDTVYRKIKLIWKNYIDTDDFHISMCAADTIFTYFQDKIGLTHYLFFVGGNNSGKSNNLAVLHLLAYRNMTSTDITAANIYQFLGSSEEGVGTICEDEADSIDEDRVKMSIYKNGYTTGYSVLRTDTSVGRKQLKLNTYCFKAFAAERTPDSVKAKGFNQRIVELPCYYGFPKYDISEVVNPAGEEEYQQLLDELLETRNLLLLYRLLHFKDKIPDIKLNIKNREKQLFKPILRIFQNTPTLNELLPVISKYISQRRESNANTLHAFLFRTIKDLIKAQNTAELASSLIWETMTDVLAGSTIPNKPLSYESSEFGTISQKGIIETLIQVFGAKQSSNRKDKRKLIFDLAKLERLGRVFDLEIQVKVGTTTSQSMVTDTTDVTYIGLNKHLQEQSQNRKTAVLAEETVNIHNKCVENNVAVASVEYNEDNLSSLDPLQASHPSLPRPPQLVEQSSSSSDSVCQESKAPTEAMSSNLSKTIYRLGHSDIFACKNCKLSGDIWFMQKHICSMSKKGNGSGKS